MRTCGENGEWIDPPYVLECQSLTFVAIETQASYITFIVVGILIHSARILLPLGAIYSCFYTGKYMSRMYTS